MKLIAGLGNPGRGYANNRHNVGFMCLNYFAKKQGIRFDKRRSKARIGTGEIAGTKVALARPQTYMNLSGQSVCLLVKKFDINLNDLLVIHDDLDLPLGKIRIRQGGGSAGHKGVNSITTELGSQDFIRIRVGIGRPNIMGGSAEISEADIITYVLSDFTSEEKQPITQAITRVSEAVLCILTEGLTAAMNKYN
ncbi:Peptidyl-tRNA hydrolase [subsurface metagenome]